MLEGSSPLTRPLSFFVSVSRPEVDAGLPVALTSVLAHTREPQLSPELCRSTQRAQEDSRAGGTRAQILAT